MVQTVGLKVSSFDWAVPVQPGRFSFLKTKEESSYLFIYFNFFLFGGLELMNSCPLMGAVVSGQMSRCRGRMKSQVVYLQDIIETNLLIYFTFVKRVWTRYLIPFPIKGEIFDGFQQIFNELGSSVASKTWKSKLHKINYLLVYKLWLNFTPTRVRARCHICHAIKHKFLSWSLLLYYATK